MGCLCRQSVGEPTRCSACRILWWATITVAHMNGMTLLPSELIGVISRSSGSCKTTITAVHVARTDS